MKKIIGFLLLSIGILNFAAANCGQEIDFDDATLCIDIVHDYRDNYKLETEISNADEDVAIRCDILLPDNTLWDVSAKNNNGDACQGEFEYEENKVGKIKFYIRVNGEYQTMEAYYDFDDNKRDDNDDDDDYGNIDEFEVELEDDDNHIMGDEVAEDTYYEINITAVDNDGETVEDYNKTIEYVVKYNDDGDRETASSSYYDFDGDETPRFSSSDDGEIKGDTEIRFNRNGEFKLYVYEEDESDPHGYIKIDVVDEDELDDNDYWDIDEFDIELEDGEDEPELDTYYDINITAIDNDGETVLDYTDEVEFEVMYYNHGRKDAPSSYYNFNGDQTPRFYSSDDGELNGETEIKFKEEEKFRLYVYEKDENDPYGYVTLDVVEEGSSNNDDTTQFLVTLEDEEEEPDTDTRYEINITAQNDDEDTIEDYEGEVEYKIYYYDNGWKTVSSTNYSLQWDTTPKFWNYDDGELIWETSIKFKEEERYKVAVYERYHSKPYGYVIVDTTDGDYDEVDSFDIELEDSTPNLDKRYDISITAIDDNWKTVKDYSKEIEYEIKYYNNYRKNASNTYYSLRWDSTPRFYNSDNGKIDGDTEIMFETEKEFRIYVYEKGENNPYGYLEINPTDTNNSNTDDGDFAVRLKNWERKPKIEQKYYIEITALESDGSTDKSYNKEIEYKIKYKNTNNVRAYAPSNYYNLTLDLTPKFNDSDDGELTEETKIEFLKEKDFRIYVYEKDQNEPYGYVEIEAIDPDSNNWSRDGFTDEEYSQLYNVYLIRPSIVNDLEDEYRQLRYSDERQDISDDFYDNMKDVVDDKDNKDFESYEDFFDDFIDRYTFTITTRD